MAHLNIQYGNAPAPVQYTDIATDYRGYSTGPPISSRNAVGCVIIVLHDSLQSRTCIAHSSPGLDPKERSLVSSMIHHMVQNWNTVTANIDVLVCGGAARTGVWSTALYQHFRVLGIPQAQIFDARVAQPAVIGNATGNFGRHVFCSPATDHIGYFYLFVPAHLGIVAAGPGATILPV